MARAVEACLYCERVHTGSCESQKATPKPRTSKPKTEQPQAPVSRMRAWKPRATPTPAAPPVPPSKSSLVSRAAPQRTAEEDELDQAIRVLMQNNMLHWTENERYARLRKLVLVGDVAARLRDWRKERA